MTPRRPRSNRSSSKPKAAALGAEFELDRRDPVDSAALRSQRSHNGGRKSRVVHDSGKQPRSHRDRKHGRRLNLEPDTDGDYSMLLTPPSSPRSSSRTHQASERYSYSADGRQHQTRERLTRSPRPPRGGTKKPADTALKNFRFRQQILSLIDQQRTAVETWAESIGADGPAEPMDWQPEQERIVYFARMPAEENCYADQWKIGEKQIASAHPELGSWASELCLGGVSVRGSPAVVGFLDEIE
ncbi:uncharacterized protein CTRU02_211947 [Colletotrichum truncatum]|uniref:Uncharacterized protein n=1 Tax=Colletotrichum truncatum TaxID=5467 RepID=A0ACC3YM71_COLTU|nr:uncharacterized protein CTRU02_07358 [Colletotrichum truncatum]KAF6791596.1 hypothetical protein CTRU02_07358 [Colletotrichum truncatum]